LPIYLSFFSLLHYGHNPHLHSFPTRRSSDLQQPIYQLAKNWDLNYPEQAQIDMIDITDLQTSYRISSIYRMPIDNMKEYISKTGDRKSTRLNSSHVSISYAVFCLKKKTRKPK